MRAEILTGVVKCCRPRGAPRGRPEERQRTSTMSVSPFPMRRDSIYMFVFYQARRVTWRNPMLGENLACSSLIDSIMQVPRSMGVCLYSEPVRIYSPHVRWSDEPGSYWQVKKYIFHVILLRNKPRPPAPSQPGNIYKYIHSKLNYYFPRARK